MTGSGTDRGIGDGLAIGLVAYLWWGLSPLYWKQFGDVAAIDTLAWRISWTAVFAWALLAIRGRGGEFRAMARTRTARRAALASGVLLSVNWGVFVWAVGNDHVVEASLGYFMNPLASVFLGIVVLGESLRRPQWCAVGAAAIGVVWLTVTLGQLPWISLTLAGSFSLYGLVRKVAPAGPMIGLGMEMAVLFVPAVVLLGARASTGAVDPSAQPGTTAALATSGVITAIPLLTFAIAARRIPLSVLGLLQYLTPTMQFAIGVAVYGETVSSRRLVGYSIIWIGLVVFVIDAALQARRDLAVARVGTRRGTMGHPG